MIERFASGAPWEEPYGYCRAVRAGDVVYVAGTTAADEDGVVLCPGDAGGQAAIILDRIAAALERAGTDMGHVVQTRIYVTDITRAGEIGRIHGERFRANPPASAMVQVAALMDPRMLVEIEAVAHIAGVNVPDTAP